MIWIFSAACHFYLRLMFVFKISSQFSEIGHLQFYSPISLEVSENILIFPGQLHFSPVFRIICCDVL